MIRTLMEQGAYIPGDDPETGEHSCIFGTLQSFDGTQLNGVVYCHGSGDTARSVLSKNAQFQLAYRNGRHATVLVPDLGFQTWGNDTGIARVGQADDYEHDTLGVEGKIVLVAISMGFSNAAAYALANPDNVLGIAGIIPLTDITDVMARGAAAEVNAAYGGYDDATDGPTHNPVRFAADLPADMPIRLWSSPADVLTPYSTAEAFVDERPQTKLTTLGMYGHSEASIAEATPAVVKWIRDRFYGLSDLEG